MYVYTVYIVYRCSRSNANEVPSTSTDDEEVTEINNTFILAHCHVCVCVCVCVCQRVDYSHTLISTTKLLLKLQHLCM